MGFLLKLKEQEAASTVGIDIHGAQHGCAVNDAINQANGATHAARTHGQADVIIEVSA